MGKGIKHINNEVFFMKIEIGESLFYSWLRHVKNCELVHLNWSTSPEWDYKADKEQLNKIVKETEVFFK